MEWNWLAILNKVANNERDGLYEILRKISLVLINDKARAIEFYCNDLRYVMNGLKKLMYFNLLNNHKERVDYYETIEWSKFEGLFDKFVLKRNKIYKILKADLKIRAENKENEIENIKQKKWRRYINSTGGQSIINHLHKTYTGNTREELADIFYRREGREIYTYLDKQLIDEKTEYERLKDEHYNALDKYEWDLRSLIDDNIDEYERLSVEKSVQDWDEFCEVANQIYNNKIELLSKIYERNTKH